MEGSEKTYFITKGASVRVLLTKESDKESLMPIKRKEEEGEKRK